MSLRDMKLSRLIIIALCALLPLLGWVIFGERGLLQLYHSELERQEHIERIRGLAEENRALVAEIERLRNDLDYIEYMARRELNMVRENETVYRFGNPARGDLQRAGPEETTRKTGAEDDTGHGKID